MRHEKGHHTGNGPKKGIYLLPNMLTSASLFGGFYAIIASIQGHFEGAATAILISCVFDALDGKVARYTGTSSDFGREYDSLCDLVAFGAAPGVLAYQWALEPFGRLGWFACFTLLICGALRLDRFNIQTAEMRKDRFKGLPIPAAAGTIATLVLFSHSLGTPAESKHVFVIILVYALSFLMVSNIEYMSFKQVDLRKKNTFNVLVSTILIFMVIAYRPTVILFLIMALYVISGPVLSLHRGKSNALLSNDDEVTERHGRH